MPCADERLKPMQGLHGFATQTQIKTDKSDVIPTERAFVFCATRNLLLARVALGWENGFIARPTKPTSTSTIASMPPSTLSMMKPAQLATQRLFNHQQSSVLPPAVLTRSSVDKPRMLSSTGRLVPSWVVAVNASLFWINKLVCMVVL
jgi:hypothetical protein